MTTADEVCKRPDLHALVSSPWCPKCGLETVYAKMPTVCFRCHKAVAPGLWTRLHYSGVSLKAGTPVLYPMLHGRWIRSPNWPNPDPIAAEAAELLIIGRLVKVAQEQDRLPELIAYALEEMRSGKTFSRALVVAMHRWLDSKEAQDG